MTILKNKQTPQTPQTPQTIQPSDNKTEETSVKYVVVREGYRVSDVEYDSPVESNCLAEIKFWSNVSKNNSYGEKVEVVQYNSKKHKVW